MGTIAGNWLKYKESENQTPKRTVQKIISVDAACAKAFKHFLSKTNIGTRFVFFRKYSLQSIVNSIIFMLRKIASKYNRMDTIKLLYLLIENLRASIY